jgi:hypothetical protein
MHLPLLTHTKCILVYCYILVLEVSATALAVRVALHFERSLLPLFVHYASALRDQRKRFEPTTAHASA